MAKLIDISTENIFNLFETTMSTRVGNFLHDDGAWADASFDNYMVEHRITTEFKLMPEDEQPAQISTYDDEVFERPYDRNLFGLPENLVGGYLKGVMYELNTRPIIVDSGWQSLDDEFVEELRKLHPLAERIFIIDEVHFEENFKRTLDISNLLTPVFYTFPRFVVCVSNSVPVPDLTDGSYDTHKNFFILDTNEDNSSYLPAVTSAKPSTSTVFGIGSDVPISPKITARPSLLLDDAFAENDTKIGRDKFWKLGFYTPPFKEITQYVSSGEASKKYSEAVIQEIMTSDLLNIIRENETKAEPTASTSLLNKNDCFFTPEDIFDISYNGLGDYYIDADPAHADGLRLEVTGGDEVSCTELNMFTLSAEGSVTFLTKDTSSYCTTMELAHAIGIERYEHGKQGWSLGTTGSKMPEAISKVRKFCDDNEALVWLLLMSWVPNQDPSSEDNYFSISRAMLSLDIARSLSHSMNTGRALEFLRAGAKNITNVLELVECDAATEEALKMLARGMTIQQIISAVNNGIDADLMEHLIA